MEQTIKYWPCKPELVCSNIDVFQSAAEQHYVKCARLFFRQVWGSHIDFQVQPVNGGYKARVMMGQYVWCSCIHSSKSVAVNAAAKASVELAMQKASRQHKCRPSAQAEMSHSYTRYSHEKPQSMDDQSATNAVHGLLSPDCSPGDTDRHYDQHENTIKLTEDQAKLQQKLLLELLGPTTNHLQGMGSQQGERSASTSHSNAKPTLRQH